MCLALLLAHAAPIFDAFAQKIIDFGDLLVMLGLWIPMILYLCMPVIVALTLGFLYVFAVQDREIVALYANKVSPRQLAWPGLLAACLGALLTGLMSLYLLPESMLRFKEKMFLAEQNVNPAGLYEGQPNTIRGVGEIYFGRRISDTLVERIIVRKWDPDGSETMITARAAAFIKRDGFLVADFQDGELFTKSAQAKPETRMIRFKRYTHPLSVIQTAADLPARSWGFFERHVGDLLAPPPDVELTQRDRAEWILEGHKRILHPILVVAYAMVAILIALSRQSLARRNTVAVFGLLILVFSILHPAYLVMLNLLAATPVVALLAMYAFPAVIALACSIAYLNMSGSGRAALHAAYASRTTRPYSAYQA
jgi:lipopolysaccharide export LptBFGC system permease protein LptF